MIGEITPRKGLITLFFLLLALYALFQGRFILLGPRLSVTSPKDNELLASPVMFIEGQAKNVASLTLDDRPIFTDQTGAWKEELIASPGLNIIKLVAKDRFGRQTEKLIRVVLN